MLYKKRIFPTESVPLPKVIEPVRERVVHDGNECVVVMKKECEQSHPIPPEITYDMFDVNHMSGNEKQLNTSILGMSSTEECYSFYLHQLAAMESASLALSNAQQAERETIVEQPKDE